MMRMLRVESKNNFAALNVKSDFSKLHFTLPPDMKNLQRYRLQKCPAHL